MIAESGGLPFASDSPTASRSRLAKAVPVMASSSERALHGGPGFAPEQEVGAMPVVVGVDQQDAATARGERRCKVRGDGGLALAGLRARDLNQLDGWREVAHGARECGKGLRRLAAPV